MSSRKESRVVKRIRKPRARLTKAARDQRAEYASLLQLGHDLAQTFSGEPENWKYTLEVVQQPVRARMCGYGTKDRRIISPVPIVRLIVKDEKDALVDPRDVDICFMTLHASIWRNSGDSTASLIYVPAGTFGDDPCILDNLLGNQVATPYRFIGTDGQLGIYFIFNDLSIRTEGTFKLDFVLMNLSVVTFFPPITDNRRKQINTTNIPMPVLASVFSEPFSVYTAKKFPGMIETTNLIRAFIRQGLKIAVRNNKGNGDDNDEAYNTEIPLSPSTTTSKPQATNALLQEPSGSATA